MDPQTLIEISKTDNLDYIRNIVECKNQRLYFEENSNLSKCEIHRLGVVMLCISLERNSDLVFGSLKHLNTMHKLNPTVRFEYTPKNLKINELKFVRQSTTAHLLDDFLMTIYVCTESPFSGARQEALLLFDYWMRDTAVSLSVFKRITTYWPWSNRNKYYFLSIIIAHHNFYWLLDQLSDNNNAKKANLINNLLNGLMLSLQYRNLISPGQTLAITLCKQFVLEFFHIIAETLQIAPNFELNNCVNHWMHCISNTDRIFHILELDSPDLLIAERFNYLQKQNNLRLLLFRSCFKREFDKSSNIKQIDAFIKCQDSEQLEVVHKIPIFDVFIANTMTQPNDFNENIKYLEEFLKSNMFEECSALRQDILKLFPNMIYLFASLIKQGDYCQQITQFFQYLKVDIFEHGIAQHDQYQPLIFSLRLFEIMLKALYGRRDDRLIKQYNPDIVVRIRTFLVNGNIWDLQSMENYTRLLALLKSDFDDIRDISCELLIRFFPQNEIDVKCDRAIWHHDIHQCSYAHYLARVKLNMLPIDSTMFLQSIRDELNNLLPKYTCDPLAQVKEGKHFFGALNCINEFYNLSYEKKKEVNQFTEPIITTDIELIIKITNLLLAFLRYKNGNNDDNLDTDGGSPSFEKMDESLTILVGESKMLSECINNDKKQLLLSIWMSLKACSDLASSIGILIIEYPNLATFNSATKIIGHCLNISTDILMKCRHKGAIEGAGLALGKLVRCITAKYSFGSSELLEILIEKVEKTFEIIQKTDTTRRGAGFSILIHHLAKSDRQKDRALLRHVVDKLLAQGVAMHSSPQHRNRDNLLASVLHFLCVLVKDGELKPALVAYMEDVFWISISTIESKEWTVRNAALQLFGAIVPKLVGQTQYFENEIDWSPVYMIYNEITIKSYGMHEKIMSILNEYEQPSILMVTLLELLSRIELIGETTTELQNMNFTTDLLNIKKFLYKLLWCGSEKVRTMVGHCLARFHRFHEIPEFVRYLMPFIFETKNLNFRHGLVQTISFLLKKYESDVRCMGYDEEIVINNKKKPQFFIEISHFFNETAIQNIELFNGKYPDFYNRYYLFDLFILIGSSQWDSIVLRSQFGDITNEHSENVIIIQNVLNNDFMNEYDHFGYKIWKRKMSKVYLD